MAAHSALRRPACGGMCPGLVPALLALGEPIEIVALGGPRDAAVRRASSHIDEPWHPPTNLGGVSWACRAQRPGPASTSFTPPRIRRRCGPAIPIVLTIHDVSYERHPEWYPYRRDVLRRVFYRRSAQSRVARAHRLAVFRRRDRRGLWHRAGPDHGRAARRVRGLCAVVTDSASRHTNECALPAGVTPPFLLHVGDLHERRNLATVVHALLQTQAAPGMPPLALVLAGIDRGIGDSLSALAKTGEAPDAVVSVGNCHRRSTARALSGGGRARLPVTVRRLRAAGARSDGLRHASDCVACGVDSRGARRRRNASGSGRRSGVGRGDRDGGAG